MTWNDYMEDEQFEVVLWLESFDSVELLRKEWADAPRFQRGHALVELLENDPPCVVRAERWITGDEKFPIRPLREHENCIDPSVDSVVFRGVAPDQTFTEIIYSEGSPHGIH